ncbi:MAG: hypothetical protein ACJ74Q_15175 [Pyrinomonadaceae bacterium]
MTRGGGGRLPPPDQLQDGSFEAGLYLLSLVTPRGVELTVEEIAEVCGCSKGKIWRIELNAMKKLKGQRRLLEELGGAGRA